MTSKPCTYCGEHHRYEHELVCDNVRPLYPLWDNRIEQKEGRQIAENFFQEEIKALKNDYMILNTSRDRSISFIKVATTERDNALRELKMVKRELWKLKNPGKMYTASVQEEIESAG